MVLAGIGARIGLTGGRGILSRLSASGGSGVISRLKATFAGSKLRAAASSLGLGGVLGFGASGAGSGAVSDVRRYAKLAALFVGGVLVLQLVIELID